MAAAKHCDLWKEPKSRALSSDSVIPYSVRILTYSWVPRLQQLIDKVLKLLHEHGQGNDAAAGEKRVKTLDRI